MYLGILYASGNLFIQVETFWGKHINSSGSYSSFTEKYFAGLLQANLFGTWTCVMYQDPNLEGKYKSKKCSWKTSELLAFQTTTTTTGLYWQKQWRSFPMKSGRKSHGKWHCWLVAHGDPSEEQHMDFSVGWPLWIEGLNDLARRGWIADKASYGYGKTFPKREWWF